MASQIDQRVMRARRRIAAAVQRQWRRSVEARGMDGIVNDAFGKSNDYDIPGSFSGLGMRRVVLSILASVSLALSVAVVVIALRPRRVGWVLIGPVTLVPDRYDLIFYWRHREVMWVDYWALSLTL